MLRCCALLCTAIALNNVMVQLAQAEVQYTTTALLLLCSVNSLAAYAEAASLFSECLSEFKIAICRENTEGEYSGLEHEVVPDVVESLKVITQVGILSCPASSSAYV